MREIKFRAWDKDGIYTDKSKPGMLEEIEEKIYWDCVFHDDDFPIMQFTGLKDKNGKEIYEGDVIKFGKIPYELIDRNKKVFAVEWVSAFEGYFPFNHFDGIPPFEVVGNIYENPELIKK